MISGYVEIGEDYNSLHFVREGRKLTVSVLKFDMYLSISTILYYYALLYHSSNIFLEV